MMWRQRDVELVVVRVDAADPPAALEALRSSDDPFDRWYADRERRLHGMHLADVAVPERLTEYVNGSVDEFDMFIASALVVRPGKSEMLRQAVRASTDGGGGLERVRRWGLKRLTIWIQETDLGDVVIYESAGEIPAMVLSMTRDDDPLVAQQRRIFDEVFGLDLATTSFPIPESAFSWSDGSAF